MAGDLPEDHPFIRMQASFEAGDWTAARAAAEQLIEMWGDGMPEQVRAGISYMVADAILSMDDLSQADIESAWSHLEAAIRGLAPESEQVAMAYLMLGNVHVERAKRGATAALQDALDAFARATTIFGRDPHSVHLAVVHDRCGRTLETLGPDSTATLQRALHEYLASYRASKAAGRPVNQGTAAYNVGRVLILIAERSNASLEEAIPFLEEAVRTYRAAHLADQEVDAVRFLEQARNGSKEGIGASPATPSQSGRPDPTPDESGHSSVEAISGRMPPELLVQVMQGIHSNELRRVFLQNWIKHHVSADSERMNFIGESVYLPLLSEAIVKGHEAEKNQDPGWKELSEALTRDAQDYFDFLLQQDRAKSTHSNALGILQSHLETGRPFVLFLRNFDITLYKGRVPKSKEKALTPIRSDLKHLNVVAFRTASEELKLADAIHEDIPIVTISDIGDVFQPSTSRRIAKLRVLTNEWDVVAGMLIGQAAAIVLFAHGLSDSLETELRLITELGAGGKLSVLLASPGANDPIENLYRTDTPDTRLLSFAVLREVLQRRFGDRLVQLHEFPTDQTAIRRIADKAVAHIVR